MKLYVVLRFSLDIAKLGGKVCQSQISLFYPVKLYDLAGR